MRHIAIVGAGQAGLQLAFGLLKHGYKVTLVTERTAENFLNGPIMSNQAMFDTALQFERELGIDFWQEKCPKNKTVTFTISKTHAPQIETQWQGVLDNPFQSIDQRMKFATWLDGFELRNGHLINQKVDLVSLDELANSHDLTIVASGKGELSKIFQRDSSKSSFTKPMRALQCLYVEGMSPSEGLPGVRSNNIPGVGEYFTTPGLTLTGPCEMMLFEGVIGGAFDCWHTIGAPEQRLSKAVALLKEFLPWEAKRCSNLRLTDSQASLCGSYTPEVRRPSFQLPSGKFVLGIGDAVVLNDPIAGQGANNASKAADIYLKNILLRKDREFDQLWMNSVFSQFWNEVQWSTKLSNLLLLPPPDHVVRLLSAASRAQELANMLANAFNNPKTLFPWILNQEETLKVISHYTNEIPSLYMSNLNVVGA